LKTKFKATYAGRILTNGKVYQRFIRTDGKEMRFSGVRGVHIGATYECQSRSINRRPKQTEDEMKHSPRWDAQEAVVLAFYQEKRRNAVARKTSRPAFKAAVQAIYPLAEGLNYLEVSALVSVLVNEAFLLRRKKK